MRLALDVSPLVAHRSGIGNYVAHLLSALIRLAPDHEYWLYAAHSLPEQDREAFGRHPQVRIIHCPPALMGWRSRWDGADVFHGLNFKLRGWGRHGAVLTIYDLSLDRLPQPSRKLLGQRGSFLRTRRAARRASRVVTISAYSAADISELYGLPLERIAIVTPAAGSEFYPDADPARARAVKARYGVRRAAFVLSGGGADPRKNIARLIEAFGEAKDLRDQMHLVVLGGMERRAESIFDAVRRTGLAEAVIFPGHVPVEDMRILYSTCAMFVFPSLYEGFGMPVLEAMACGAPVVSSNAASLPEVAGDAALLVDPRDTEALASAMTRMTTDQELRHELRQRGRRRVEAFSWDRSAREQLRVYQDLLA